MFSEIMKKINRNTGETFSEKMLRLGLAKL